MEHSCIQRHANALIFDRQRHTIERFNPVGQLLIEEWREHDLDRVILEKFNQYQIIPLYLESVGMQVIHDREPIRRIHYNTDPKGMCTVWVIWYLEVRFTETAVDDNHSQDS